MDIKLNIVIVFKGALVALPIETGKTGLLIAFSARYDL